MNSLDTKINMVADLEPSKKLPIQNDQQDDSVNTWDQLTEQQQQDILAHLTAIPFE
ncbi:MULTISPECIES: hypothetical protein [unclassified Aliivibrio]|jgi:hypothetical protein|uniref:hypothetical protein n=1 Tax=unclassified Aliivibrio TaxID=2645654 RepID=UPI000AEB6A88|nr:MULTISPECIES: hypothetical protein [unclassified Aliivibrio]